MASPLSGVLDHFLARSGVAVTIYRSYGTPQQSQHVIARALKNTKTKRGGGDIFQFKNREDVQEGDIIQQANSADLWLVTGTQDFMDGEDLLSFDVEVERATRAGAARPKPGFGHTVNVGGNVVGGLQVGSHHGTQTTNVTISHQVAAPLHQLSGAIRSSELDELDREELLHEVSRVEELAKRGDDKVKPKILERLAVVEKGLAVSQQLVAVAAPLIAAVRAHYGV